MFRAFAPKHHRNHLAIYGISSCIFYGYLSLAPITDFYRLMIGFIPLFCLWLGVVSKTTASPLSESAQIKKHLLLWACLFRLICWFSHPILEDDWIRYLWDGYLFSIAETPYAQAPEDFFEASVPDHISTLLNLISYPDLKTIYGPLLEWIFWINTQWFNSSLSGWKLIVLLADMLFLIALFYNSSVRNFAMFAWCPILLHSFAINLHAELIAAGLCWGAWLMAQKLRPWLCGILLGMSIGCKITAILLAPYILWRYWKAWLSCTITALIIYTPFLYQGSSDLHNLLMVGSNWQFNTPFQLLLSSSYAAYFATLKLGLILVWMTYWGYRYARFMWCHDKLNTVNLLLSFFLISGTFNAWYIVWLLLPFEQHRSCRATSFDNQCFENPQWVIYFSGLIIFSYGTGLTLPKTTLALFEVAPVLLILEYGILAALILYSWKTNKLGGQSLSK